MLKVQSPSISRHNVTGDGIRGHDPKTHRGQRPRDRDPGAVNDQTREKRQQAAAHDTRDHDGFRGGRVAVGARGGGFENHRERGRFEEHDEADRSDGGRGGGERAGCGEGDGGEEEEHQDVAGFEEVAGERVAVAEGQGEEPGEDAAEEEEDLGKHHEVRRGLLWLAGVDAEVFHEELRDGDLAPEVERVGEHGVPEAAEAAGEEGVGPEFPWLGGRWGVRDLDFDDEVRAVEECEEDEREREDGGAGVAVERDDGVELGRVAFGRFRHQTFARVERVVHWCLAVGGVVEYGQVGEHRCHDRADCCP